MKRTIKAPAQEALLLLLDIIADNVRTLMVRDFDKYPNMPKALGDSAKIGKATVQRLLRETGKAADAKHSPNLTALVALAYEFQVPLQYLLTDHRPIARVLQPTPEGLAIPSRVLERRRSR